MRFHPGLLSSAAAVAFTCAVSAAAYYYKSRNPEINEVMVFCKLQFNAHNTFDKLISYVEAAKRSINVCMPSIHNSAIQGRLMQLILEKGIKVHIIIDRKGYNESTEFFLKELLEAGAEIKCKMDDRYKMQHKFCLVDDRVLMTGTLDWGNDLSSDNWNYVYITNKAQLVDPVKGEFYQMWNTYMDIEEVLKVEPVLSDADDIADESQELSNENVTENKCIEIPYLRETQLTPEICIM